MGNSSVTTTSHEPALLAPALTAAFVAIFYLCRVYDLVAALLPGVDVGRDYLDGGLTLLAGHCLLYVLLRKAPEHAVMQYYWLCKTVHILFVSLYYEVHYRGVLDQFSYFDQSLLQTQSGTHFIAVLTSFLRSLIDSYAAVKVLFSGFGTLGLWLFYRGICRINGAAADRRSLIGLLFFPSLFFWSSIIGKDPLMLLALGLFFRGAVEVLHQQKSPWPAWPYVMMGAALLLAGAIRWWMVVILGVPAGLVVWLAMRRSRFGAAANGIGAFALLGAALLTPRFLGLSVDGLLGSLQGYANAFAIGGSSQHYWDFGTLADVIVFLPVGMFSALFRPIVGEVGNVYGMLAGAENLILLAGVGLTVAGMRMNRARAVHVVWIALVIAVWAAAYAFISPFNLGTCSRYRAQILPFMLSMMAISGGRWRHADV